MGFTCTQRNLHTITHLCASIKGHCTIASCADLQLCLHMWPVMSQHVMSCSRAGTDMLFQVQASDINSYLSFYSTEKLGRQYLNLKPVSAIDSTK